MEICGAISVNCAGRARIHGDGQVAAVR